MARFRYPTDAELQPTEEEKRAARDSAGAQQTDSAWGSGIGTVLGGLAGLAPLLAGPAGAALVPTTLPAGLAAGGAIGGSIGGLVGSSAADKADQQLSDAELERQKRITALKMRDEALTRLLGQG